MPAKTVISAACAGTANETTSSPKAPATAAVVDQLLMMPSNLFFLRFRSPD